jgi:peptidoglycan hydrolase CwlO-like protein
MNKAKVVAFATTGLMVAAVIWLMNTRSINSSLEQGLQKEKLKSESLLSEKLLLEKDIQKIKEQLSSLQGKNTNLDAVVRSTSEKLERQESEYNRMRRENQSLTQIKKQRQELIALQSQLENEVQSLKLSYAQLESRNSELNNTIASLQERNKMLTDDLNRAMLASVDHSQIQAVKGKTERLTISAKRTRKLIANFEVPADLKQLSFRIIDSKGNALSQNDGTIASTVMPSESNFTASADDSAQGARLQQVQMVYLPTKRLKSGLYTVEILNENLYVGSLRVKLK